MAPIYHEEKCRTPKEFHLILGLSSVKAEATFSNQRLRSGKQEQVNAKVCVSLPAVDMFVRHAAGRFRRGRAEFAGLNPVRASALTKQ